MTSVLLDDVRALLDRTLERVPADQAATLEALRERLDAPLRVAIAGKVKAGKSTLLNALVGERLAPTDAGECTRIVTSYRHGHSYRVTVHPEGGDAYPARFDRVDGALEIDLNGTEPESIRLLDVEWASSRLDDLTLIDTPGLDSVNASASATTEDFLAIADDAESGEADAVIYLMRHLHKTDLGFLESFHDHSFANPSPINSVAVLSRADEVGACRLDAMHSARRVAHRYRHDARLGRLCQAVVPVAGLLAEAGATLTEAEYHDLVAIAALERDATDRLLMTVDRFVADTGATDIPPLARTELLERLGLYGVRVAVGLLRVGAVSTARELAEELKRRSGIEELRELLMALFAGRRDVLKARAALAVLDEQLGRVTTDGDELRMELERITANAHELVEVQLLNAVRSRALPLSEAEAAEIDRLLSSNDCLDARLDLAGREPRDVVLEALDRWHRRAENPMSSRDVVVAAHAVIRTYEGIVAGL